MQLAVSASASDHRDPAEPAAEPVCFSVHALVSAFLRTVRLLHGVPANVHPKLCVAATATGEILFDAIPK